MRGVRLGWFTAAARKPTLGRARARAHGQARANTSARVARGAARRPRCTCGPPRAFARRRDGRPRAPTVGGARAVSNALARAGARRRPRARARVRAGGRRAPARARSALGRIALRASVGGRARGARGRTGALAARVHVGARAQALQPPHEAHLSVTIFDSDALGGVQAWRISCTLLRCIRMLKISRASCSGPSWRIAPGGDCVNRTISLAVAGAIWLASLDVYFRLSGRRCGSGVHRSTFFGDIPTLS